MSQRVCLNKYSSLCATTTKNSIFYCKTFTALTTHASVQFQIECMVIKLLFEWELLTCCSRRWPDDKHAWKSTGLFTSRATFTWKQRGCNKKRSIRSQKEQRRGNIRPIERDFSAAGVREDAHMYLSHRERGLHFHSRVKDLAAGAAGKLLCRKKWKMTPSLPRSHGLHRTWPLDCRQRCGRVE